MTKTNTARTHYLINAQTRIVQGKPMSETLARTMAAQLNSLLGADTVVVVPVGWQGAGLN